MILQPSLVQVTNASGHHGSAKIHMHANLVCMHCAFSMRSEEVGKKSHFHAFYSLKV